MARRANSSKQTRLVLQTLNAAPASWWYGYELAKTTGLKSGTLYPILMRLSDQGFLVSEWREPKQAGRPPRHVYQLSASGIALACEQQKDEAAAVDIRVRKGAPA